MSTENLKLVYMAVLALMQMGTIVGISYLLITACCKRLNLQSWLVVAAIALVGLLLVAGWFGNQYSTCSDLSLAIAFTGTALAAGVIFSFIGIYMPIKKSKRC